VDISLEMGVPGIDISTKNSVRARCLRHSGHALSVPSETSQWPVSPHLHSIQSVAFHIALQWQLYHFFSLCSSSILNEHSGIVANWDSISEWVYGHTLASRLQCPGWRCENYSLRSIHLRTKWNSLLTNYTHRLKSPDLDGDWPSIVCSICLQSFN